MKKNPPSRLFLQFFFIWVNSLLRYKPFMSHDLFFNLFNLLLTMVLVALLSIVLLRTQLNKVAKFALVLIMFSRIFSYALIFLWLHTDFLPYWSAFYRSTFPLLLLNPALIYFYIVSLCDSEFGFKDIQWYHSIPFVFGLAWYLAGSPYSPENAETDQYFRAIAHLIVMLPYYWGSIKVIERVKKTAENQRSSLVDLQLPWLQFLLIVCFFSILLVFLEIVLGPHVDLYIYKGINTNLGLIGLIYYGLRSSELFKFKEIVAAPGKENVTIQPEELQKLSERLDKILKAEQLFLRPQIRLSDVAQEMGIKSYKLSEVIKQGLNTNFYNLINNLRAEHVIQLMKDPSKDYMSLLGLAMESGFNSKSVFNEYFRKKTGMTPSAFRLQFTKESE